MTTADDSHRNSRRAVALWLFVLAALVYAMVVLGGVTRLTGSGLSMVDWRPVTGVLPPLSDAQWEASFERYRSSPEYQKVNSHMDVDDFKGIFWLEYLHRLLGRLLGIAFLLPFAVFALRGWISRSDSPKYLLMFALGGLQGLLGWYMVKSGLVDDPRVSQYRLAAHLVAAIVIYLYILWIAWTLWHREAPRSRSASFRTASSVAGLVGLTIISGAFVAGLDAGTIYNSFPKMGPHWIPPGLTALEPGWRNLFENMTTVQFNHRWLATTTVFVIAIYWLRHRNRQPGRRAAVSATAMMHAALLQLALGIATLLAGVPVWLAASHQGVALLVLTAAAWHVHALRRVD